MTNISVIIPVYNEEKDIIDCLKSLSRQSFKGFEIILIDDGSTDNTLSKVIRFQRKCDNLKILKSKHLGPGAARNFGARGAVGDILVFVDADMTFHRNFLTQLVKPIEQGYAKGTFSKDEFVSNWNNKWSRCWNLNEGWPERRRHLAGYPDSQPVFRAILKREFDKVGGFTPGGYTDDYSLSSKLGYMAIHSPGAVFYHKNPERLAEVFKHASWAGKREYKMGFIGLIIAILRSSLPVSLVMGTVKSITGLEASFLVFKVIYDLGVLKGIFDMVFFGKVVK